MISEDDIYICSQHTQDRYVKLNIMDKNDNIIDEISGKVIDGTITMDGTANIQRQCDNLKILLDDASIQKLLPNKSDSLIWTNKHFQLFIGIRD